jgi:hypothetical protein
MLGFEIGQFTAISRCEPVISFAFFCSTRPLKRLGFLARNRQQVKGLPVLGSQLPVLPSGVGWNADRGVGWPEEVFSGKIEGTSLAQTVLVIRRWTSMARSGVMKRMIRRPIPMPDWRVRAAVTR